jgi:PAS domain S-box-containing protein
VIQDFPIPDDEAPDIAAQDLDGAYFKIAADAAGLGVWRWDLRANVFSYSERAKEIYGFPPGCQVTYEMVAAATHPEDRPRTLALAQRSFDPDIRAKESYRYRIVRPSDGAVRWIVAQGVAEFGEVGGKMAAFNYVGTLQDITEQKRGEDALEQSEARLRLAVDAGRMAVWEIDLEKGTIAHSEQLNRLCGFPPEARPTLEDLRARYAPGERERMERESAAALARGETQIESEIVLIWPDGTPRRLLLRAQMAPMAEGQPPKVIGVLFDITEVSVAEEALRRSERRLRMSQEAAGIGSLELDIVSGEVIGTDVFWRLWGLGPRESVHISTLEQIVVPEDGNVRSTAETRRNGNAKTSVQYRIRRPDTGELRWLSRHIEFVHGPDGKPSKMFGVMQDITERKAAEARQELLTHELEHRVKNILAMVSAIATQTLRSEEVKPARETFLDRMRALAKAHDLLTETRWTTASLQGVIETALCPHVAEGGEANVHGPELKLHPKMALSLALSVNELATNAAKYGALSVKSGHVDIGWVVEGEGREKSVVWTWQESGGPVVSPPKRRGFGSVLIDRVLAADFGGTVAIQYPPEGVKCVLRFPFINLAQQ